MFLVARSLTAVIFGFCTRSLASSKRGVTQLSSKCAAYTYFKKILLKVVYLDSFLRGQVISLSNPAHLCS